MKRGGLAIGFLVVSVALGKEAENSTAGDRERFISVLEAGFSEWDGDGDGILSVGEINDLVSREDIRGDAAAAIAALKRASRFRKIELPSFTPSLLKELATNEPKAGWPDLPAAFAGSLKRCFQRKARGWKPFDRGEWATVSPSPHWEPWPICGPNTSPER
jgi:hypothetical protein